MRLLFKLSGLAIIIIACFGFGYLKANRLRLRVNQLYNMQKAVTQLKQLIRLRFGEVDRLITQSFGSFPIDYSFLTEGDKQIIESLIKEIGTLDTDSAYNHCEICLLSLGGCLEEAQKNHRELGKLYKSIGALAGVFICILLI